MWTGIVTGSCLLFWILLNHDHVMVNRQTGTQTSRQLASLPATLNPPKIFVTKVFGKGKEMEKEHYWLRDMLNYHKMYFYLKKQYFLLILSPCNELPSTSQLACAVDC